MWWNYGFGWFFPGLFFLGFWLLIILLFWGSWRRWGYHESHHHWEDRKSAEDILAERFARGEIDSNEYNERLGVLRKEEKSSSA